MDPPPDIKSSIEKTVEYVRKNGAAFELKLLQNDPDGKFAFLQPSNKYNEYYKKLLAGNASAVQKTGGTETTKAPSQLLFVTELPPISSYDLDVIKLTAMYFVSNSQKHTDALQKYMDRKGNRNQFAFLNRNHSLHAVYRKYCQQYQAIAAASMGKNCDSTTHINSLVRSTPQEMYVRAYERAVHERKHKMDVKAKASETRKLQLQYALIDWQDFAFVAKVNFDAVDEVSELALPLKREDVMYRALLAKNKELQLDKAKNFNENKEEDVSADKKQLENTDKVEEKNEKVEKTHNVPKGMKIRAAGESRLKRKHEPSGERTIQCPITGQLVPELKFDNHLKVLLRDPRYKEQQDNFVRKNFAYASNLTTDQVYENIKRLVNKTPEEGRKRVDIGPH